MKLTTRCVLRSRHYTQVLPSSIEFLSHLNKHYPQVFAKIAINTHAEKPLLKGRRFFTPCKIEIEAREERKKNSDLSVRRYSQDEQSTYALLLTFIRHVGRQG